VRDISELVVWCFSEDEKPIYIQGSKGAHEMTEPVTAEDVTRLVDKLDKARLAAAYWERLNQIFCTPDNKGCTAEGAPVGAAVRQATVSVDKGNPPPDRSVPVIDLDADMWASIEEAASRSPGMPENYMTQDWVNDVINFLIEKPIIPPPLKWTRDRPTTPGSYWVWEPNTNPRIAVFTGTMWMDSKRAFSCADTFSVWVQYLGPLAWPKPPVGM
jgi:hypothetical protein